MLHLLFDLFDHNEATRGIILKQKKQILLRNKFCGGKRRGRTLGPAPREFIYQTVLPENPAPLFGSSIAKTIIKSEVNRLFIP